MGNLRKTTRKKDTDVRQGTLALMVPKTLDVLSPLHGDGLAKRTITLPARRAMQQNPVIALRSL